MPELGEHTVLIDGFHVTKDRGEGQPTEFLDIGPVKWSYVPYEGVVAIEGVLAGLFELGKVELAKREA